MMVRLLIICLSLFSAALPAAAQKLEATPRTLVMVAFEPEWQPLVREIKDPISHSIHGQEVLMRSGVSMVNAAMNTQLALERFAITRILFSGIAGGIDPGLRIGDVLIADEWAPYLEGAFARRGKKGRGWAPPNGAIDGAPANWGMMFPRGVRAGNAKEPVRRHFSFPADPSLLALARRIAPSIAIARCAEILPTPDAQAERCLPYTPQLVIGGRGVSAGIYMDNPDYRRYLFKAWKARALDMESAAVLQVAYTNQVPALIIRSLSDLAGGDRDQNKIRIYGQLTAINAATVTLAVLAALPD
jgi:adenosylhomocysteine nucleosidase